MLKHVLAVALFDRYLVVGLRSLGTPRSLRLPGGSGAGLGRRRVSVSTWKTAPHFGHVIGLRSKS